MKKAGAVILKILGTFVLILIVSLMVILLAAPIVNDHVAQNTVKKLENIPLPNHTEYIESVNKAGKVVGCGNGMQYFGAILIKSELSLEELEEYHSDYAEKEWECIVENQAGTDINAVDDPFLSFNTDAQGDDHYIVYSWGDNDTIFFDLDNKRALINCCRDRGRRDTVACYSVYEAVSKRAGRQHLRVCVCFGAEGFLIWKKMKEGGDLL